MAFTIPDKGEGDNDIQSILFQEHLDILVDGISGKNCVLSGCAVTGGADMTPEVAKGAVLSNGVLYAIAATTATIGTADATNPRIDLVVVNSSGSVAVRAGTAAAAPKPPARTANDVVLAAVYVPANDTAIATTQITDMRMMRENGPICIYRTTTAETTDTTTSAIHVLNKTGSGVTIPSGLFLAGRILRVRIGGNMLVNSGTPTIVFEVLYGGTVMFSDTSTAMVADTDRCAWYCHFDLVAQGNSDQSVAGHLELTDPDTARTAPTTGIGDVWGQAGTNELPTPFSGSAAVDSDAANRVLAVTFTFNVSNAANQIVTEFATVDLV